MQYARDMTNDGSFPKDIRIVERAGAEALKHLATRALWNGYSEWRRINLTTSYSTGTIAISSATVTGSGTTFATSTAKQLIVANGEGVAHEISTRDSATQLTLKVAYQSPNGTSVAAGSTYKIYYWSYDLPATSGSPYITRNVREVRAGSPSRKIDKISFHEMVSRWTSFQDENVPAAYAIKRDISASDATEQQRLLVHPAASDTYVLDVLIDRWPSTFPSSGSGIVDVPPYLEEAYKGILLWRLSQGHVAWANKMQIALANMKQAIADAKREDATRAPILVGDMGHAKYDDNRQWVLPESY